MTDEQIIERQQIEAEKQQQAEKRHRLNMLVQEFYLSTHGLTPDEFAARETYLTPEEVNQFHELLQMQADAND